MIDELLGKWSTPFALATAISAGAAWLTTTSNNVEYMGNQVASLKSELDAKNKIESSQEDRLARIETKIDMLIDAIKRQHTHESIR